MNPFEDPQSLDTFVVFGPWGKITFPGVCSITVSAGITEDQEDVAGQKGTKKTVLGYSDKEVVVTNRIWTASQYNKLKEIVRLFQPVRGNRPIDLEAVHPTLSIYKVGRLYIFKIETEEYTAERPYETVFRMREWQTKTIKTATASNDGEGKLLGQGDPKYAVTEENFPTRASDTVPGPTLGGPQGGH